MNSSLDISKWRDLVSEAHSEQAATLGETYERAVLAHEPFTDVLGLANELMPKRYGVRLPDYFVSPKFRRYCEDFAASAITKALPIIIDEHDRSNSGALASLSGMRRNSALLEARKVRILIYCKSATALKLVLMQLGHALCRYPQYVEWIKIAEGCQGNASLFLAFQRSHAMKEAA